MLHGRVSVMALLLSEWDLRFVMHSYEFLKRPGESLQSAGTYLLRIMHKRFRRVRRGYPVPLDYDLEKWDFSSFGESLYG